jgi:hypothetical protein
MIIKGVEYKRTLFGVLGIAILETWIWVKLKCVPKREEKFLILK